jgi:ABC-type Na+ efflux pump permease subunit
MFLQYNPAFLAGSASFFFLVMAIQYLETICLSNKVRQELIEKTLDLTPLFYISAVLIYSIDSMF